MKTEAPAAQAGVKDLIGLDAKVVSEPQLQHPSTLAELLTQDGDGIFPFFTRVEQSTPGQAFLIWKARNGNSDRLILGPNSTLQELNRQGPPDATDGKLLAMVVVRDRTKGTLKPTYEELIALGQINRANIAPRQITLINAGIRTLFSEARDLELFLTAETRGRRKEIEDGEIMDAADSVVFQADSNKAAEKLMDRFHHVWQFAFVRGTKLSPEQARSDIKKFQNLTA